jgi:Bacterial Ig-like domain (group 1)
MRITCLCARYLLLAGLTAGSVACSHDETAPVVAEPAEVIAIPTQLTLRAGSTASLAAQANDTRGQAIGGVGLRFTAIDPSLLSVTQRGQVTAVGRVGRSAIRITSGRCERTVPVTVVPGAPEAFEKLQGDKQEIVAGQAPAAPLVVRLTDRFGNAVQGASLVADLPAGSEPGASVMSSEDGIASFAIPTLTRAGAVAVTVHLEGKGTHSALFDLQVKAGPAASIMRAGITGEGSGEGEGVAVAVQVLDSFNNPVAGEAIQWTAVAAGRVDSAQTMTGEDGIARARWYRKPGSTHPGQVDAVVVGSENLKVVLMIELEPVSPPAPETPQRTPDG